jgi:ketosteroid isomerase-like protein
VVSDARRGHGGTPYVSRHAGARQYFEDRAEFSKEGHIECPEVHDLGHRVLGLGRFWMRFTSGVELDQEIAFLSTWRNGKCVESRTWRSYAEALEAAGLRESSLRTKSGGLPGA